MGSFFRYKIRAKGAFPLDVSAKYFDFLIGFEKLTKILNQ